MLQVSTGSFFLSVAIHGLNLKAVGTLKLGFSPKLINIFECLLEKWKQRPKLAEYQLGEYDHDVTFFVCFLQKGRILPAGDFFKTS